MNNMQRIFSVLILLILFSAIVASQSTEDTEINPKEVTSEVIEIEISGKIHIADGIEKIIYNQTFPVEDANQKVLSVSSTPEHTITTDEQGNREIVLTWNSPESNVLDYKIVIQLERKSFPIISIEDNTKEYLRNDNNITLWNDEIKNKAFEITNNSGNDLIKSAKISKWVHENVEYAPNFSSTEETAIWVFENRKGVCDEFSHLLISMARYQNIPAREVGGFEYYGKKWIVHAWVEIYYDGKWIPFDPTHNEMGIVDGTHIAFSRDADNVQIGENIHWEGHKEVTGEGAYNEKTKTIKFLKINKTKILDAKFAFCDNEVGENTVANATLELKNLINAPLFGTFDVFVPKKIDYLNDPDNGGIFYLEPYAKTNLTLNFKVPKIENASRKYVFPVNVETFPYATTEQELSVNPRIINGYDIITAGRGVKIDLNIINRNPIKTGYIVDTCIADKITKTTSCKTKTATLDGNSNKTLEFLFESSGGNYSLSITANTSESYDKLTGEINVRTEDTGSWTEGLFIFTIVFLLLITIIGLILIKRQ